MTDSATTGSTAKGSGTGGLARCFADCHLALIVALAGVLTEMYGAFGYRMGWVPLLQALLTLLPVGARVAGGGAALCLVVAVVCAASAKKGTGRGALIAVVGIVVGAIGAYIPYSMQQSAKGAPQIHDVTTDTDNPPQFVDALPLRKATNARNSTEYKLEAGRPPNRFNVPEAQHKAFPDIQPVVLQGVAPADAFKRALDAVNAMNWHLTAAKPDEGRIEAWDKTLWFGFIDDMVIRITPVDNGSKVDVRSLSRIGGGDAGTNARRIRHYIAALVKS